MKINFRHGIISHQSGGFLQVNGLGHLDLLAANKPLTVTLAHRDTDYTHSEDNTIGSAWVGPFTPSTNYYLYWEFNQLTFERIFDKTLLEPVAQSVAPGSGNSPIVGVVPGIASPAFGSFDVEGHYVLPVNKPFSVVGSTGNDFSYTVQSTTYNLGSGTTTIVVNEEIPDTTIDGELTLDLDYNGNPLFVDGRTWFDTTNNIHYKLVGTTWVEILRVYAAQVYNSTFISLSQTGNFTGTQIGNNNTVASGRILFGESGDPIRRDDGTFFTTEDQFFTNQSRVDAIRLESNVSRAQSDTGGTMAAFGIVAWTGEGKITPAQYNDIGSTVVGVLTETLNTGEVGAVIVQGTITNPDWTWTPTLDVGAKLWISNGVLTATDPHVADPITYQTPQVPVARVLSVDTIIFEQGLGGIGPQGPTGSVDSQPFADDGVFGITSITPAPEADDIPIAVGLNHPIIKDGLATGYSINGHGHTALEVSVTSVGDVSNTILQSVIGELALEKLNRVDGGTMEGILTLSGAPIDALDAATKAYVDSVAHGLDTKESVVVASTTDMGGVYSAVGGTSGTGAITAALMTSLDGTTTGSPPDFEISVSSRILIKDQTDAYENGIYVITAITGSPITTIDLERAADHDGVPPENVSAGNFTFVQEGLALKGTGWIVIDVHPEDDIVLNEHDIDWSQVSTSTAYIGSTTINIDGSNVISVPVETVDALYWRGNTLTLSAVAAGQPLVADATGFKNAAFTLPVTTGTDTYVLTTDGVGGSEWHPPVSKPPYEKIVITGSPVSDVLNTIVATTALTGSPPSEASLQVFRNGILQQENVSGSPIVDNFAVTGANQITFTVGTLQPADIILIYAFN